jgi:hypothetical protein
MNTNTSLILIAKEDRGDSFGSRGFSDRGGDRYGK